MGVQPGTHAGAGDPPGGRTLTVLGKGRQPLACPPPACPRRPRLPGARLLQGQVPADPAACGISSHLFFLLFSPRWERAGPRTLPEVGQALSGRPVARAQGEAHLSPHGAGGRGAEAARLGCAWAGQTQAGCGACVLGEGCPREHAVPTDSRSGAAGGGLETPRTPVHGHSFKMSLEELAVPPLVPGSLCAKPHRSALPSLGVILKAENAKPIAGSLVFCG